MTFTLDRLDKTDCGILTSLLAILVTFILAKGKVFGKKENVSAAVKSRNIVEVIEKSDKKAVVIYTSQTGTAEDYATKFARQFQARFQLSTLVVDTDDYDLDNLNEIPEGILLFFFVSSYGEGELPDSGTGFGEYLDTISAGDLSNVQYTIFGLGNSTYEFFNGAAKKVDKDLTNAGATKFAPYGEGDDGRDSLDEDFLAWKEQTFELLKNTLSLKEIDAEYEPGVLVIERPDLSTISSEVFLGEHHREYLVEDEDKLSLGPFDHSRPYLAPVTKTKGLFNSKSRHCIHAEFDLSKSNLRYSTGDHLAILPPNSNEEVDNFLKAFGLYDQKDTVFEIKSLDATTSHSLASPTTFEAIARYYLEITGPVSRQFLASIAEFAPTPESKEVTNTLATDKELFHKRIAEQKFNISDALLHLSGGKPWSTVPKSFIIDSIPVLQPRFYSISSSALSEKQTVHITAVVEAEEAPSSSKYVTGVTTNLLHNLEVKQNGKNDALYATYDLNGPRGRFASSKLPVFVRRSNFKLPSNPALPVILIGPGTGVAPLRGFVRERVEQVKKGIKVGKIILFFGCRNSNEDFLYKEEWEEYAKILGEDNFELVTAFSRESSQKVYVQHRMAEKSKELIDLINQKAFIYVCGDASSMARSVQNSLASIIAQEKGTTEETALETLRAYKTQNRYQEDVW